MTSIVPAPNITTYINVKDPAYGAKGDGTTNDTAAINAAISAAANAGGGVVFFPSGSYLITSTISITSRSIHLLGSGITASRLLVSPSFAASTLITVSADFFSCEKLWIQFANATYSSNPIADCLLINPSYNFLLRDLLIENFNGWGVKVQQIANSYTADAWSSLDTITIKNCAQGISLKGYNNVYPLQSVSLSHINVTQIKNGDGIYIEDGNSIKMTNIESGLDTGAGSALHIKGASSIIYATNSTLGGNTPNTTGPCVLVESGTNGTPKTISFSSCDLEQGLYGIQMTAATETKLTNCTFMRNASHHLEISGAGTDGITVDACSFNNDGVYGRIGTPRYDIDCSAGGQGVVTHCLFLEAIGTGTAQVDAHCNFTNGSVHATENIFKNGGAFAGLPSAARSNIGYNPLGVVGPPSMPASGTALTNPYNVDCLVYVSGGTVSAIAINGTSTGLISGSFRIPSKQSIKITYTAAPSWMWVGD